MEKRKAKRIQQEIACDYCNKSFEKAVSEIKRSTKHYCSRSCSGKGNHSHLKPYKATPPQYKGDEFTGFREFLRRANKRDLNANITLDDIKECWDKQQGLCVYSGVRLKRPFYKEKNDHLYTASLDRISSKLGYVKGNIQFVSIAMNHMKNSMEDEEVQQLLMILRNHLTY